VAASRPCGIGEHLTMSHSVAEQPSGLARSVRSRLCTVSEHSR
jgi:hypothetical protein